ncbi:divergent PAP2 family protein [Breznakiellaceae bacterium SP9]
MFFPLDIQAGYLSPLFENPVFLSAVSSWVFAQIMKAIIAFVGSRKSNAKELAKTIIWNTGGMPSSHAAVVSAMVTAVGIHDGIGSNLFTITFFLAMIVMRDAMGVRLSSGIQGRILNNLGRTVSKHLKTEFHPIKEVHGHTPMEVIVGSLLGIFIAAAYAYL